MAKITPEQLARPGTELAIQTAMFCALADIRPPLPFLQLVQAFPAGGERAMAVASRMKASGSRKGTWDVMMPFPRQGHFMGWVEMKKPEHRSHKNGGLSDEQIQFGKDMHAQGAFLRVCYSWEEGVKAVCDYIALGPVIPLAPAAPIG